MSRNELTRPVMGTIFLVLLDLNPVQSRKAVCRILIENLMTCLVSVFF